VIALLNIFDDVRFGDLRKHHKIINTLLCEPLLRLELRNLFGCVPLATLKSGTLEKDK
jgi:hypothetical protein